MLLGAIIRQWLRDAVGDPSEIAMVASWLDMAPADLPELPKVPGARSTLATAVTSERPCLVCGGPVEIADPRIRRKVYCGPECYSKANKAKARERKNERRRKARS